ncbi:hypothetical protein D9M72_598350 [compost metagenome]
MPKPPPMSAVRSRTSSAEMPSGGAMNFIATPGWLMLQKMSNPPSAFHVASVAKGSSGVLEKRWKCSRSIDTFTSAAAKAASTSPHSKTSP